MRNAFNVLSRYVWRTFAELQATTTYALAAACDTAVSLRLLAPRNNDDDDVC